LDLLRRINLIFGYSTKMLQQIQTA